MPVAQVLAVSFAQVALNYFYFIFWLSFYQMQYEFDTSPGYQVLFVFAAQLAEIGGFKKEPQNLRLFLKLSCLLFIV